MQQIVKTISKKKQKNVKINIKNFAIFIEENKWRSTGPDSSNRKNRKQISNSDVNS